VILFSILVHYLEESIPVELAAIWRSFNKAYVSRQTKERLIPHQCSPFEAELKPSIRSRGTSVAISLAAR
jgi:hypothetical protein